MDWQQTFRQKFIKLYCEQIENGVSCWPDWAPEATPDEVMVFISKLLRQKQNAHNKRHREYVKSST